MIWWYEAFLVDFTSWASFIHFFLNLSSFLRSDRNAWFGDIRSFWWIGDLVFFHLMFFFLIFFHIFDNALQKVLFRGVLLYFELLLYFFFTFNVFLISPLDGLWSVSFSASSCDVWVLSNIFFSHGFLVSFSFSFCYGFVCFWISFPMLLNLFRM